MLVWQSATTVSTAHFFFLENLYAVYSREFASLRTSGAVTGAVDDSGLVSVRPASNAEVLASLAPGPFDTALLSLGCLGAAILSVCSRRVSKWL
jgi:hypothetical protein